MTPIRSRSPSYSPICDPSWSMPRSRGLARSHASRSRRLRLEVNVGITKEVEGETKVKFWVYEAGLEGKASKQNLHRILLKIKPTYSGVSLEVSGETAMPG